MYMLMRDAEGRKESKVIRTTKQHNTPKAVTFPEKNELPRVGFEPATLYTLDRAHYQLSHLGSSAGWAPTRNLTSHISPDEQANCKGYTMSLDSRLTLGHTFDMYRQTASEDLYHNTCLSSS